MHVFVWQKTGFKQVQVRIAEHPFCNTVIARLMMFDTVVSNFVTEREEEMILPEMLCPEESRGFIDEFLIGLQIRIRSFNGVLGLANQIQKLQCTVAGLLQQDLTKMF